MRRRWGSLGRRCHEPVTKPDLTQASEASLSGRACQRQSMPQATSGHGRPRPISRSGGGAGTQAPSGCLRVSGTQRPPRAWVSTERRCVARGAGQSGPSGRSAEALRSPRPPEARSAVERGLRGASWPRPEPPSHSGVALREAKQLLIVPPRRLGHAVALRLDQLAESARRGTVRVGGEGAPVRGRVAAGLSVPVRWRRWRAWCEWAGRRRRAGRLACGVHRTWPRRSPPTPRFPPSRSPARACTRLPRASPCRCARAWQRSCRARSGWSGARRPRARGRARSCRPAHPRPARVASRDEMAVARFTVCACRPTQIVFGVWGVLDAFSPIVTGCPCSILHRAVFKRW